MQTKLKLKPSKTCYSNLHPTKHQCRADVLQTMDRVYRLLLDQRSTEGCWIQQDTVHQVEVNYIRTYVQKFIIHTSTEQL